MGAGAGLAPAVFVYGTLMDTEVLALALGRQPDGLGQEAASIAGYARRRVQGQRYPMLIARSAGKVDGVLIDGLAPADINRLRAFEGRGYLLGPCRVITRTGRRAAWVFLPDPHSPVPLRDSGTGWDLGRWRERDKPGFLASLGRSAASVNTGCRRAAAAYSAPSMSRVIRVTPPSLR